MLIGFFRSNRSYQWAKRHWLYVCCLYACVAGEKAKKVFKTSCRTSNQPCGVTITVRMHTTISPGQVSGNWEQGTGDSSFGLVRPHQHGKADNCHGGFFFFVNSFKRQPHITNVARRLGCFNVWHLALQAFSLYEGTRRPVLYTCAHSLSYPWKVMYNSSTKYFSKIQLLGEAVLLHWKRCKTSVAAKTRQS